MIAIIYDIKRRCSTRQFNSIENDCIFCNKKDLKESLRQVMTFKLDLRVRHRAKLSNDFDLLAKIGDGNIVAMEKWKMTMIVNFMGLFCQK